MSQHSQGVCKWTWANRGACTFVALTAALVVSVFLPGSSAQERFAHGQTIAPGMYVLRAMGDDMGLQTVQEVTITVVP